MVSLPTITTQPQGQTVLAPATATLSVVGTGTPAPTYQWNLGGVAIAGATSASYTTAPTVGGSYSYTVTLSNTAGSITSAAAMLTVNAAPVITTQPQNQTITSPAAATFTATASGSAPLAYQWKESGSAISGATSASYTTPATAVGTKSYTVTVSNSFGSVTSAPAVLTVVSLPAITTQPQGQAVIAPATATFTVAATGTPALTYQWYANWVAITGATTTTYTTPSTVAGSYIYSVTLSNAAGSTNSSMAVLTVNAGSTPNLASSSNATVISTQAGPTPFIGFGQIGSANLDQLTSLTCTIEPNPGTFSTPVKVQFNRAYLTRQSYLLPGATQLSFPMVGLYANQTNSASVELTFSDNSVVSLPLTLATAPYVDANGIYTQKKTLVQRGAGSTLGYNYFYLKSNLGTPVILDTDGQIRWIGVGITNAMSSLWYQNQFVVGDQTGAAIVDLVNLDGTYSSVALVSPSSSTPIVGFHHNFDFGKVGILADVYTKTGTVINYASTVAEINTSGQVLNTWDLASIISYYMDANGDNSALFVRPGTDWFHQNSAVYDPSDDSIIVSSRENFVIKCDYQTGTIKWILGDPTKYWFTFPSLRAKAIALAPGGLYPVGQHALSITHDGLLMLFNDGTGSTNQPAGAPPGIGRSYSAVSAYAIDAASFTAREALAFNDGQSIYSSYCSSAVETQDGSMLIDYAVADLLTEARIQGVDPNRNIVFDFQFKTTGCNTSWNAQIFQFESLVIN